MRRMPKPTILSKQGLKAMPSKKKGLYDNIHAKRKRIKAGSGEKMRKAGEKGAPTAKAFKAAAKTAKKPAKKRK
jgi:hypothetical protein